jgi:hypothetical protein
VHQVSLALAGKTGWLSGVVLAVLLGRPLSIFSLGNREPCFSMASAALEINISCIKGLGAYIGIMVHPYQCTYGALDDACHHYVIT